MMIFKSTVVLSFVITLFACQSTQKPAQSNQAMDAALNEYLKGNNQNASALNNLPEAVTQALLPDHINAESPLFGESKYDINARNIDASTFFSGIVQDTPYSVALHPEVGGTISLVLKQVSLDDVFSLVSEMYGYQIERKQNIYRIYPAGLRTESFAVNYLLMKRDGATETSITSGGVTQQQGNSSQNNSNSQNSFSGNSSRGNNYSNSNSRNTNNVNGTNISTRTETDFWSELLVTLKSMIDTTAGQSVMVTPQAGLVTVRAMPEEIRAIKNFLHISEEIIQRQVILEARIIEVSLNDGYQQGINWSQILANVGGTDFNFSTSAGSIGNNITAAIGNVTSLSFTNKDFSGVLSLLSTQGTVQVLSSPRVTAVNNQKAVIKVGDDEYFVTDVSSQSTISSSTTSIVPNIELTPFFSGIALDVTPQIDKNGVVLLHVHPSVIETQEQEKTVTLNQEQFILPLAQSNIRESDTIIRARSGEIVVIGGLMQSMIADSESQTPILGDIPILGNLFKSIKKTEVKKELVILLKPTVVDGQTWRNQMQRSRDQMADWLRVE